MNYQQFTTTRNMEKYRRWKWEKCMNETKFRCASYLFTFQVEYNANDTLCKCIHTFWLLPVVVEHLNVRTETKRGKNVIINHSKKNTRSNGKIVLQSYPSCLCPTSSCGLIERSREWNKKSRCRHRGCRDSKTMANVHFPAFTVKANKNVILVQCDQSQHKISREINPKIIL